MLFLRIGTLFARKAQSNRKGVIDIMSIGSHTLFLLRCDPWERGSHENNMKNQIVTRMFAGLLGLGSLALMSWTNPQSSDYERLGLDNPKVTQAVDDDFSFLTDDSSQPYMTICVNKNGGLLVHWGNSNKPTQMLPNNVDELKQIILRRFAAKDYPKENELFHIEISPSTPDSKVLAISDMLMEIGVRCCHLAFHSPSILPPPPPPVAITQEDVLSITKEEPEENTATDDIYQVVEEQPLFPGGMDKMAEFLQANIKYPALCKKEGIQGRVVVQFVVNKDGSICDAKVVKSAHPQLDAEAIRVISSMPRWIPGKQKGKNVRVRYTLPVHFRLP